VLRDGHQFVFNFGPPFASGYLAVQLEEIDGRPVVRRSLAPGVHSGDTILAIDGVRVEQVYARQYRLTSTATHGYQFDVASRYVSQLTGPVTLKLRDAEGDVRHVVVEPQPFEDYSAAVAPGESDRPSGLLADLGAPDVYYLNMDAEASPSEVAVTNAIAEADGAGARALVLDMRGYPGGDHYASAERLIREPFSSARFNTQTYVGPDSATIDPLQYGLFPAPEPAWDGPIVLLTGTHAVSAAENFMQMLVGADRLTAVVGRRSAGTNGNITGVQLPGGFGFTYTGMQVLNVDGSQFHGIGIVPDVPVEWTATALRDGVDLDILAALDVLAEP
jgi:C-terminal processing protease CtpA/Prc